MKSFIKNLFLLPALIAGLGLIPAGLVTAQTFTVLHSFISGYPDYEGGNSTAGLILSGNTLYGTAVYGGSSSKGTVFKVNTNGTGFTILHSFTGGVSDGNRPYAGLFLSGTTLFGTTYYGGSSDDGTVFKVNTDGTGFTIVYSFTAGSDGSVPMAGVILSGTTLYGTASGGGSGAGTVFKVNTDGTGFTNLHSFAGYPSDGANPDAVLVLLNNTLYGTTSIGGTSGWGTVFKVNTDGTGYTNLYSFTASSDGGNPNDLILSGNTLYGTAYSRGSAGEGTVFKINTDGTSFTTLYSFTATTDSGSPNFYKTNSDGANPDAGLILSGNTLYGTAYGGGSGGQGTVFKVNTDGTGFTNLFNFTLKPDPVYAGFFGYLDGAKPHAGLILSGNTLYGTASDGGSLGGTVFSVTTPTNPNDCLFDWAERTYPLLFPPAASQSLTFPPYYYRYYSGTFNYLAVSSADNHIWVLGPISGNSLLDVAPVANYLSTAGCQ